ncbi:MAG: helix-turn-helix domain-containing protein [Halioglobus sp.]
MAKAMNQRKRAPQMEPEERKLQLLRAGVACMAAKGIGATKHADLARACNVSVPTIFTYFPNRDALVTSTLEEVGQRLIEAIVPPAEALPDPDERLAATATLFCDLAVQEPDYVKVWLMWNMHFAPELQQQFRKFEARLVDSLMQMIKDSIRTKKVDEDDIRDRAQVISASSAFLAKMVFDGVSEARRDSFVEHILTSLVHD